MLANMVSKTLVFQNIFLNKNKVLSEAAAACWRSFCPSVL